MGGNIMNVTLTGLLTGVIGTGIGGVLAYFISYSSKRFLSLVFSFSGGLMVAVSCFDLLPEAFKYGGEGIAIIGLALGVLVIVYLEAFITKCKRYLNANRLITTGILVGLGIALHNFPEGIAVGSGFEASYGLGLKLVMIIALHDVPEGVAMALPLKAGGMGGFKVILYTILSGVPMGLGAYCGFVLGEISSIFVAVCLSFAAGAMLYVVFGEILPEASDMHRGRLNVIGCILGIIAGMAVTMIG